MEKEWLFISDQNIKIENINIPKFPIISLFKIDMESIGLIIDIVMSFYMCVCVCVCVCMCVYVCV